MPQPQINVTASQVELARTASVGLLECSAIRHWTAEEETSRQ